MRNELVPFLFAQQLLEVVEENEPFLVWYTRESVVWIFSFEIDDHLGKLMLFSKVRDRVGQSFPSDDGGEVTVRFAMSTAD